MGYRFEIGQTYTGIDKRMKPMTVIRRTEKTIFVKNEENEEWNMKIHYDDKNNKNEYVIDDKHAPLYLKGLFCYLSEPET